MQIQFGGYTMKKISHDPLSIIGYYSLNITDQKSINSYKQGRKDIHLDGQK